MLACRRLFFLGFIGRSPSAGGNALFLRLARRGGGKRNAPAQPGEALASPGWFCLSGRKCCKSQGKQALHACMQAPVFLAFIGRSPSAGGNVFVPPAGTARRRGERASAAVWIYTNFFFCDVQNSCCQAQIAQNPPGISGIFYICRKNVS